MSRVRTVLGEIPAEEMGIVDAHDHLFITGGPEVDRNPNLLLDDYDEAVDEVRAFAEAGGRTIVDAMPSGCGRDAERLAAVARATGVHVIATAGFHKREYYDRLHWARRYPVESLVRVLYDECAKGIDRWDSWGPLVERTPVRPGVLKAGAGFHAIRDDEIRFIRAVGQVQQLAGLPVMIHSDRGTAALRQVELLVREGVAPHRIGVSHMDRNPDVGVHRELAARGCFLIYDGLYREHYRPVSAVSELIRALCEAGYSDRLLLGGDVAVRTSRRSRGALGIAGLLTEFVPALKSNGVDVGTIREMLVVNPPRFFRIDDGRAGG